jgi:hypothetical protein
MESSGGKLINLLLADLATTLDPQGSRQSISKRMMRVVFFYSKLLRASEWRR